MHSLDTISDCLTWIGHSHDIEGLKGGLKELKACQSDRLMDAMILKTFSNLDNFMILIQGMHKWSWMLTLDFCSYHNWEIVA